MFIFDGGFKLDYVWDVSNKLLLYIVNKIMMCIDFFVFIQLGEQFVFKVKWWYNINDCMEIGGCFGYEYFEEDDNYLYIIVQFFLWMAVYNDVEGWQNKQFLGCGEFILFFGDYKVNIIVLVDYFVVFIGIL